MPGRQDMRAAAIALVRQGFSLIKLNAHGTPVHAAPYSRMICSEVAAASLWTEPDGEPSDSLPGVVTGGDLLVVDVDVKNGRPGLRALDKLRAKGLDTGTRTVQTPSGGMHLFYRKPAATRTKTMLTKAGHAFEGIDFKGGEHGYVMGAGSVKEGATAGYVWQNPDAPVLDAPEWLLDMLAAPRVATNGHAPHAAPHITLDDEKALFAVTEYLMDAPLAVEGEAGRKTTLDVLNAAQDFGVTFKTACRIMDEIWSPRCSPPWDPGAIEETARGLRRDSPAGIRHPDLQATAADFGFVPPGGKGIVATPFTFTPGHLIPPRQWIYGRHYVAKFLSTTVAPGGLGKSSLVMAEALAICTGKPLLGIEVQTRGNVWYWNGEDPKEELDRRFTAIMMQLEVSPADIAGRLFVDTGRESPLLVAKRGKDGIVVNHEMIARIKSEIRRLQISVLILDPFIRTHRVSESDNNDIDLVAQIWVQIADETNCSIELVHHVRKTNGAEITVEDGRGAVALLAAARSARTLNRMSEEEAARAGVADRMRYFRTDDGKQNLAPAFAADWYEMSSVALHNATADREGDHVGVVRAWEWPAGTGGTSDGQLELIRAELAKGHWKASPLAADWAGRAVQTALDIPAGAKGDLLAKAVLKKLLAAGALEKHTEPDPVSRHPRSFIRAA